MKAPKLPKSLARPQKKKSVFEKTMLSSLIDRKEELNLSHLYLARAGETFVAAQLLRRGLNATAVSVDSGVDILAHQEIFLKVPLLQAEQLVYQFQVKTTATNEYRASMPVRKVHELWHKVINLIVVFWSDNTVPDAIVIPPSLIRMLTTGGFDDPRAPIQLNDDKVSLRVFRREDQYFIRNKANPLTPLLNQFSLVEPVGTDTGMFPPYAYWGEGDQVVCIEINHGDEGSEQLY